MVRIHLLRDGEVQLDAPIELTDVRPGMGAWVDVDSPTAEELALLGARFGFHPLAIEDCVHPQKRAKFERFPSHGFLVLQPLDRGTPEDPLDTVGVCVFVRPDIVVSVRQGRVYATEAVARHLVTWPPHVGTVGERVVHALIDRMIDEYTEVLWELEERVDALEARAATLEEGIMDAFTRVRRDLLTLRRISLPQRDMVRRFVDADAEVSPDARMYFRDVLDHVEFVHDETNLLLEVTNGAMQLQASVVDNRLNAVMKYMAVVSTILLPMTVISGAFGMNFDEVPWSHVTWGFWAAVSAMLASAVGLLIVFRWRRWF